MWKVTGRGVNGLSPVQIKIGFGSEAEVMACGVSHILALALQKSKSCPRERSVKGRRREELSC